MSLPEILTFIFVASLLVMSPGPNGVLIAKTVPTSGRTGGFANIAGFLTAFYLHGTLSVLGISFILVQSAFAFSVVKFIGAAYLIWIGIKALYDAYRGIDKSLVVAPARNKRNLGKAFLEGLLTNGLNPKVSMFYLAAFPQFIGGADNPMAASFLLVTIHAALNAVWFGALVLLFARLAKLGSSSSFQRWLKGLTGVVFVGFGVKLATYRASL